VPDEVGFATKPQHGLAMLARAQAAGVLTGWVTADEAYGQHPTFRTWLAEREVPFVLATRNDDVLVSPDGHRRQAMVLATIAGHGEGGGWERRSVGPGAHGEREYDWTAVALDTARLPTGWGHWLLVRRQTEPEPGKKYRELAFYRCAAPAATPLRELIQVAGARWRSRSASRPRRMKPASTTTKFGTGGPGTPTSPWPCSPPPTSPRPALRRSTGRTKKGTYSPLGRADPTDEQRDPTPAHRARPHPCHLHDRVISWSNWRRPTTPSPQLPLPTPRAQTAAITAECRCSTNDKSADQRP
jgi:hypothetical protein